MGLATMAYVKAACPIHATISSTGGKFQPVSNFTVTSSYSSHLFLCTLDALITSKSLYFQCDDLSIACHHGVLPLALQS